LARRHFALADELRAGGKQPWVEGALPTVLGEAYARYHAGAVLYNLRQVR